MIDPKWATEFAKEWIDSWNSHDLKRILSHYTDNFEMKSPLILERVADSQGCLIGKDKVSAYWKPSFSVSPPLRFELIDVLTGVDSITLYYRSVNRRIVAETLLFNEQGKATKGMAQWSVHLIQ
ncbi:MAG: nuclear transport factor 2 family protein [Chloroflexi bacterium]|nr:nuclear transport factor 2 family protein [Chloroflexota bacterium]MDA1219972.1 nuclear transport factor 2 family protein [Chloroflexota bacterium]